MSNATTTNHNATTTTRWELVIDQDESSSTPELYYAGLEFRMVSFNNRHINFEDPDILIVVLDDCEPCQGDGWDRDNEGNRGEGICEPCHGDGYITAPNPDVLATLSYYEHGLCRWMVGDSTVPDHGGFDTVGIAGVIVKGKDFNDTEWLALDDETRVAALDWVAEEYTEWSNGETYIFQLREIEVSLCGHCGANTESQVTDDFDGWESVIGRDAAIESIRDGLACGGKNDDLQFGGPIDLDKLTITGDAADRFEIYNFRSKK